MSGQGTRTPILARFYRAVADGDGTVSLELVDEPLEDVSIEEGRLIGPEVIVDTRAVLVGTDTRGRLIGVPVEPLTLRDGSLCFDPSQGGIRMRENRRACGAFNRIVAEANHFGMVNAYVHTRRAAQFVNQLLTNVGARSLPPVTAIVGAHFGSKLPGYAHGDGDYWSGHLRPLSGGHYRTSAQTTGVPELFPVAPTGEIHLGPMRYRKPFAGWQAYLGNAAHNPAIIYHEFGHHLCRHTADFRLNAERPAADQRNGKIGIEEGICDYFTGVLLDSGRPFGWYRAGPGSRRDLEPLRQATNAIDRTDAHAIGAPWAAAFWRCRNGLVAEGLLDAPIDHDQAVAAALVKVGEVAGRDDGRTRSRRERARSSVKTLVRAYRSALKERGGPQAAKQAMRVLEGCGLIQPKAAREARLSC